MTVHYVAFGRGSPAGIFHEAHLEGVLMAEVLRNRSGRSPASAWPRARGPVLPRPLAQVRFLRQNLLEYPDQARPGQLPGDRGRLIRKEGLLMTDANPNDVSLTKVVQRDPDIHSGDLVFTGTRVPVDNLVDYLKGGDSIEEFLQDYPTVQRWQLESYLELSPQGLDGMRARNEDTSR